MDQLIQDSSAKTNTPETQRTSIGVKLTIISVGLLFLSLITYSAIGIQVRERTALEDLENNMRKDAQDQSALIRNALTASRTIAVNLATAIETGRYNEKEVQEVIQNTILRNEAVFGTVIGYEPNKFRAGVEAFAPYYYRTPNGTLQLTELDEQNYTNQGWYRLPKRTATPFFVGPYLAPARGDTWIITWSAPIDDGNGNFRGVAAVDSEFTVIENMVSSFKYSESGYILLVDTKGYILGTGNTPENKYTPLSQNMFDLANSDESGAWRILTESMIRGEADFITITDTSNNVVYISYEPIGLNTGWSIAIVQPRSEIIEQNQRLQGALIGYSLLLAIFFGVLIFYFTRTITNPLAHLTKVAQEISNGNLRVTANVKDFDEVGILAQTINHMTAQLQDTLTNLEHRITERTVDLEIARRQTEARAAQLFTIGDISKIINSEQALDVLLPLITRLVSERLNFYHTGIFLVDEAKQYAILQAANSAGGQNMLKRGHKLKVGESGIVGYVAKTGTARIALDVGQDAVYFNNPDMPTTRSEMALPLKIRENIIGVLDVQSEKPGAFTQEDINILGILADQVAIAIENTRLLEQAQQALNEARTSYMQNLQKGWQIFSEEENVVGFQQTIKGGKRLTNPISSQEINQAMFRGETLVFHADGKTEEPILVVPIKLREQIIGVMNIKAPSNDRQWTTNEINLTEAVSERLSLALENARLIQDSQRQVIKEQTIGEITSRISSSINLENVLLTAVEELGRTIPGSEVTIKLKNETRSSGADKE